MSTEASTPRRREAARRAGHVARSDELTRTATLVAAAVALAATAAASAARLVAFTIWTIDAAFTGTHPTVALTAAFDVMVSVSATWCVAIVLVAILAALVQVGPLFTMTPISPDARRLARDPSFDGAATFAFDVLRVVTIAAALGLLVPQTVRRLVRLPRGSLAESLTVVGDVIATLGQTLLLGLVFFAFADLVWRRVRYERELRMTTAERRQEARATGSSPEVRAERKRQMRES